MELSEIRKKIDEIDAKLLPLFVERMQCAEQVAQTKKERGLPIFNAQREQEILDKVALSTPDFDCEAKMLYTVMMALSRARQHKLLHSGASVREEIERALQTSPSPSVPKVACPGVFGSFSHEAAKSLLPNGEVQFYTGFPDIFQAIETGGCRFGVVPVENSSAGSVAEVYDLLLHYRFHIVGAAVLQIRHCLAAPQGASLASVRKVYSHPQALAQCSQLLHSQGWDGVQHSNTAAAAKMVAQTGDPSQAAICSTLAAKEYGLQILRENIQNKGHNRTRFVVIEKEMRIPEDAQKISLCFSLPHTTGSLYSVLARFAMNGLNLTKIESRPTARDTAGGTFEYDFYLDFTGRVADPRTLDLICELSEELPHFSFLGNYREDVFSG